MTLTSREVTHLLGITRQALHDRVKNRSILRIDTGLLRWQYPEFQFVLAPEPHVHPALKAVLRQWDQVGKDWLCDDELTTFLTPRAWMLDAPDTLESLLEDTRAEARRLMDVN